MTKFTVLFLFAALLHWDTQVSNTTASLRGLKVVSPKVVWASGTQGTFLRTTDGGLHWLSGTVGGAEKLDFRDVEAFDEKTAYLLASGEGDKSRVYKTSDAGAHWELLLTNPDEKDFFDDIAFGDAKHAMVLGDPVGGQLVIFTTADGGATWQRRPAPLALDGEGAFAASGTSLVMQGMNDAWFATGGPAGGRVFRTHNGGRTWGIAKTPLGGSKTAGIFSLAFRDGKYGIAVGGDYQNPKALGRTAAVTHNGGKTWQAVTGLSYRSCVAALGGDKFVAVGTEGADLSRNGGETWTHFSDVNLSAVAGGGDAVWAVGPKGVIVKLAQEH